MRYFTFSLRTAVASLAFLAGVLGASAQRQLENLGRGVATLRTPDNKIFVAWRLLGNEPADTAFNVYRATSGGTPVKLNAQPLTAATSYTDATADLTKENVYTIRAVVSGREGAPSAAFLGKVSANASANGYFEIPLALPEGYQASDASAADLDGDGEYEIVLHIAGRGRDNSQAGLTTEPMLQAYKFDGSLLWTINLGKNIREGAHYTQFMVYDLDGDGRAEIACKTADGTVDGRGKVIGDAAADWRVPAGTATTWTRPDGRVTPMDTVGYILSGPEYFTIFEGATGAALATTNYVPARHPNPKPTPDELNAAWGDPYGNRVDRFLAGIAYLDGQRPTVVMCRGYYFRATLTAWDWRDGKLTQRWHFDSRDGTPGNERYNDQGNHNLSVADIDGDGRDEIIFGAAAIDDNGKGLYSTRLSHGDALHVSDLDPTRPGLEVFDIHENARHAFGIEFRDARTGEMIWGKPGGEGRSPDVGRGVAMDIDPRHPGAEMWSSLPGLYNTKGETISEKKPRGVNFAIWWDGDLLREILDSNRISKWNWETESDTPLLVAEGASSINGSKSTPVLSGDLFGDWREEVILRSTDNKTLRIYATTIPTEHRFTTLMHDSQYRVAIAWQNVAYNQPPHPSFFLGEGMKLPAPRPTLAVPVRR